MPGNAWEPELSVSALEYDCDGPCAVVRLAGRAGIADSACLRVLLELQAAQEQGRLVIDLSRLSSMDWWIALILMWIGRMVSRRGGVFVLAAPQPAVARLLKTAGAPQVVTICDSIPRADSHSGESARPRVVRLASDPRATRLPPSASATAATC